MTSETTSATEMQAFVLWFREAKAPSRRRTWEPLGTYANEREAWQASMSNPRGSGDYQILPQGQEP